VIGPDLPAGLLAQAPDVGGWLHDIDPFAIRITPQLIRWYGLSYMAGFVLGFLVLRALAKRGLIAIPAERVFDAIVALVVGVIVGGRLGYCLFYRPSYLWSFDGSFPFWRALAIHDGGMASHGGMIGVVIACWLISRGFRADDGQRVGRCPTLHVTDAVCLAAPFGLFFGRIANFINGELLGRIVVHPASDERAPWWSVRYPQELLTEHGVGVERTPEQQFRLARLIDQYRTLPAESDRATIQRMIDAVQAGSAELQAQLAPLISARHPSQLYQAAAEGIAVGLVVWFIARRPRWPGVVSAWFLISYGVLRVLTEFYRLPDAHFDEGAGFFDLTSPRPLGLSRGQWLSVAMVLAGGGILVWRRLKPAETRSFGWLVRGKTSAQPGASDGSF